MEVLKTEYGPVLIISVILALCSGFNLIFTAIQNSKTLAKDAKEPFVRIDKQIDIVRTACAAHTKELDERLDAVERRINQHDVHIADLHAGQSCMCWGVQALLDHELHNGNEDEMKSASERIGKWLRTRAVGGDN